MQNIVERGATYADLEAVSPQLVAEILHGSLVTRPRPAPPHSVAAASLTEELVGPFQKGRGGPGGWFFMTGPELHLGDDVAVPELAGWRREGMPMLPATTYVELEPDWICEVLSPFTETYHRGDKRLIYARAAVSHLWLVDPRTKLLEAFDLTGGKWLLSGVFEGDASVRAAPFDAVEFRLGLLWPLDTGPSQT